MSSPAHPSNWTGAKVAATRGKAYKAYRAAKTDSYRAYFTANAHLRATDHEYKALDESSGSGRWGPPCRAPSLTAPRALPDAARFPATPFTSPRSPPKVFGRMAAGSELSGCAIPTPA